MAQRCDPLAIPHGEIVQHWGVKASTAHYCGELGKKHWPAH